MKLILLAKDEESGKAGCSSVYLAEDGIWPTFRDRVAPFLSTRRAERACGVGRIRRDRTFVS